MNIRKIREHVAAALVKSRTVTEDMIHAQYEIAILNEVRRVGHVQAREVLHVLDSLESLVKATNRPKGWVMLDAERFDTVAAELRELARRVSRGEVRTEPVIASANASTTPETGTTEGGAQ